MGPPPIHLPEKRAEAPPAATAERPVPTTGSAGSPGRPARPDIPGGADFGRDAASCPSPSPPGTEVGPYPGGLVAGRGHGNFGVESAPSPENVRPGVDRGRAEGGEPAVRPTRRPAPADTRSPESGRYPGPAGRKRPRSVAPQRGRIPRPRTRDVSSPSGPFLVIAASARADRDRGGSGSRYRQEGRGSRPPHNRGAMPGHETLARPPPIEVSSVRGHQHAAGGARP
jgi:hypothetical protein